VKSRLRWVTPRRFVQPTGTEFVWKSIGQRDCQTIVTDQRRGKEHEYKVITTNKASDDEPSNTVMVVL